MIEIYLLEQLAAFAKYGTLSQASEELHLTQPSLSRSMKKIEEMLGVPLFDRQKNKIALNENGLVAAQYAERILREEADMVRHLRTLEKSRHTLSVGSVAPGPLMELMPSLSARFADMTMSSEIKPEDELLDGLRQGTYQIIVLARPVESAAMLCSRYGTERLYAVLPKSHHYAKKKKLCFRELNGESFLVVSQTGCWEEQVQREMPDSRFLIQSDMNALGELIEASQLPNFATDIVMRVFAASQEQQGSSLSNPAADRVVIPITDDAAELTFYLVARSDLPERFRDLLE